MENVNKYTVFFWTLPLRKVKNLVKIYTHVDRISWAGPRDGEGEYALLPTECVFYWGQQFQIHTMKQGKRGTYFCVADNEVGEVRKMVNNQLQLCLLLSSPGLTIIFWLVSLSSLLLRSSFLILPIFRMSEV